MIANNNSDTNDIYNAIKDQLFGNDVSVLLDPDDNITTYLLDTVSSLLWILYFCWINPDHNDLKNRVVLASCLLIL